ncbi:N-acetyltransferase [Candidatus Thorarchaeota archaeon]|nr:MAG: N-acetyltransferase [Candidatus Thorarchaeota archaeon]
MLDGIEIRLVLLEERHLDDVMKGWNNPEMREFLGGFIPQTREAELEWIKRSQEQMKNRQSYIFVIERKKDQSFIGTVALHDIDWLSRTSVLGIAIHDPKNWDMGFGTEAMKLLIGFGWRHLNLRRIELSVHDFNERAKHVYEKVGFKEFGLAHQKYFINGKYVDTHYMELFRSDE